MLRAQEAEPAANQRPEQPFAVIAVAGIDRILDALDFSFEAADRPEASEAIGGFLDRAGELKGIDHSQGFGVMIFLAGIMPQPVGYVPVDKIEDLMKTIKKSVPSPPKKSTRKTEAEGAGFRFTSKSSDVMPSSVAKKNGWTEYSRIPLR